MSFSPAHRCPRRPPRRGLTLVEVMISLVLVSIGLLGVAGASSLSLRALAVHDASMRATRSAARRLSSLEAGGCASARDGSADELPSGLHESWHVASSSSGLVMVDDSLTWTVLGHSRQLVMRGALLC